jgi:hypothetical protein
MGAGDVKVSITKNNSKACNVFDGVDDYVKLGNSTNLNIGTNSQTYSLWFNTNSATIQTLLLKREDESGTESGVSIKIQADGRFRMYYGNGSEGSDVANVGTANIYNKGNWQHLVYRIDRIQGLQGVYINGALIYELSVNITGDITNDDDFYIGTSNENVQYFDGSISDVKIWNRALTTDEIAQDYAGANITDGLIHHFKLGGDYTDYGSAGADALSSGTRRAIVEDAIASAISADRTTANDQYMIFKGEGGEVGSVVVEEAP